MAPTPRNRSAALSRKNAGWAPFGVALVAGLIGAMGAYALQYEPRVPTPLHVSALAANPADAARASNGLPWLQLPGSDEPIPTLAELLELKASLINAPDSSGEFARLAGQMLFIDAAQRFHQLRTQGGDAVELNAVAQLIDEELDARLRRGELALADAHMLKQQILHVREPDAVVRQAEFVRWAAANATPP
jgi:hypothetical protein